MLSRRGALAFALLLVGCKDPASEPTGGGSSGSSGGSDLARAGVDGGTTSDAPPLPGPIGGGDAAPPVSTAGCGKTVAARGFVAKSTLTVEGQARTYASFVPNDYDPNRAYPIVFGFHGDGGTGANARSALALEAPANGGAIFVYPDGLGKTWELDQPLAKNRDIKLVVALAAALGKEMCVDAARIFAVGTSRGAYFVNQLACRTPIRGIAAFSGGGPYGLDGEYDANGDFTCPAPSPAALVVHGANDGTVDVSEGRTTRDAWRKASGCAASSKAESPSPCVRYDGCAAGRPLVYCEVPGLGHSVWPSGPAKAWSFFSAL